MSAIFQIIAAYVLADALSALYHLFTDRGYNTKGYVFDFQNHHDHPETMTFDLQPMMIGVPMLIMGCWWLPWFNIPLGFFLAFAQIPHYYTHFPAPKWVKVLQDWHIFLPVEQHMIHHTHFDRDFCVISGWNNWWINRLAPYVPMRQT